jgi:hypothetical protein
MELHHRTQSVKLILRGPLAAQNAVRRLMTTEGPSSVIADLSLIEIEQVPGYFVRSLAWTPSAIPPGKRLILVAPQPVIYGLSRMFHLWRGETSYYKIVRTREEAYELLDLEAPDFQVIDHAIASVTGS